MKKTLTSILAATLILSALTGCSDGTSSLGESSSESVSQSTETSSSSSSESSTAVSSATSSETSSTSSTDEDFVVPHREITPNAFSDNKKAQDFEQALNVMREYAYWQFTIIHPNEMKKENDPVYKIVDTEQSIKKETEDNPYWFYKVVKGEMSSEKRFNEALDKIFTEKFKSEFFEYNKDDLIVSDGFIYLNFRMKRVGAVGTGMSYLELNSFEYPDENTILMTVTSVGDKNEWGLDADLRDTITVKFVRKDGTLRIDEINDPLKASISFGYYPYLSCENLG